MNDQSNSMRDSQRDLDEEEDTSMSKPQQKLAEPYNESVFVGSAGNRSDQPGQAETFGSDDIYNGPPSRRETPSSDTGQSDPRPATKVVSFQLQDDGLREERLAAAKRKLDLMRTKSRTAKLTGDVQLETDLDYYIIPDIEASIERLENSRDDNESKSRNRGEEVPNISARRKNQNEDRDSIIGASTARNPKTPLETDMASNSESDSEADYDTEDKRSPFGFEIAGSEGIDSDTDDDDLDSSTIASSSDDPEENTVFAGLKPAMTVQIHDAKYTGSREIYGFHSAELMSTESVKPDRTSLFRWV